MEYVKQREIVLWGNGIIGEEVAKTLHHKGYDFSFSVSNDLVPKSTFYDKPIKNKNTINNIDHYVIISTKYYDEISQELDALGFIEKIDYYCWCKVILNYDLYLDHIFIGRNSYGYTAFSSVIGTSSKYDFIESIGRFTSINNTAQIHGDHSLKILSTGFLSFISNEDFEFYRKKNNPNHGKKVKLTIGNDVWIGANSFINYNKVKRIGNGAIIGAGAIVINDIPPYAVAVGVPARIAKYRFSEKQIEILERVKWWEWEEEKLKKHSELFLYPELFFEKYDNGDI